MRSRHAKLTHGFLRTLIRPFVGSLPIRAQRKLIEGVLLANAPAKIDVAPVQIGNVPGEILTPANPAPGRILYYLHGGGYCLGSLASHRMFVALLAKKLGCKALHIDYRLAPEHPFPAGMNDAIAGYRWLLDQGYKAENIVIAGESAGGGLTLATLLSLRDAGLPLPRAAVVISPWIDLAMSGTSIRSRGRIDPMITHAYLKTAAAQYHGEHDPRSPLVSPLYADLSGLPPLLIHAGDNEVLLDDARGLAERYEKAGSEVTLKVWTELFHAFHLFSFIPEAREAVREIEAFVKLRWTNSLQDNP